MFNPYICEKYRYVGDETLERIDMLLILASSFPFLILTCVLFLLNQRGRGCNVVRIVTVAWPMEAIRHSKTQVSHSTVTCCYTVLKSSNNSETAVHSCI